MDLFGIWRQLAQGQTVLIATEASRLTRLVGGLLIPLGSVVTGGGIEGTERLKRREEVLIRTWSQCWAGVWTRAAAAVAASLELWNNKDAKCQVTKCYLQLLLATSCQADGAAFRLTAVESF